VFDVVFRSLLTPSARFAIETFSLGQGSEMRTMLRNFATSAVTAMRTRSLEENLVAIIAGKRLPICSHTFSDRHSPTIRLVTYLRRPRSSPLGRRQLQRQAGCVCSHSAPASWSSADTVEYLTDPGDRSALLLGVPQGRSDIERIRKPCDQTSLNLHLIDANTPPPSSLN
jgi:hypothetical protein